MYYPLMLNIKGKTVVVIGGGRVSYRKVKKFLEFEGIVKVISPEFTNDFKKLKSEFKDKLYIINDRYNESYIDEAFLVVAATSNKSINEKIRYDCNKNNILCNIVDDVNISDFIVPSSIKRGSLVISVSTMAKSPSLASKIKKEIEKKYSSEYEEYVDLLGIARNIILKKYNGDDKKNFLHLIINMSLNELKSFINYIKEE